jgi:uncharacterized membrane protein
MRPLFILRVLSDFNISHLYYFIIKNYRILLVVHLILAKSKYTLNKCLDIEKDLFPVLTNAILERVNHLMKLRMKKS